uniref:Fucolectin tachylectin-4 pentraxin-1 domain-containing protein n=1 Tax=Latimeria chalumnae TaxID=7897 RepID=H2ZWZ1_LATCH
ANVTVIVFLMLKILCIYFFKEKNVGMLGNAAQSSTAYGGAPGRAIDGNRNNNYWQNSCTHTKQELNPWWRVDLLKPHKVSTITIVNRKDCCATRLQGAEVRIGNSLANNGNDNPVCGTVTSLSAGSTQSFCCNGMEGRYVSIQIPGRREYLTLCEVEVFGVLA